MNKLLLFLTLTLSLSLTAQVGINTENPRALLDIKAQNENALTNTAGVMVTEDGLLIPRVTTLLIAGDQPIEGLLVFLTTTFTDTTPDPDVVYEPGFYVSYGSTWETFGGGTGESLGQLRLVDEGNGNGYRLFDVDPANYGNIGVLSKDFSLQQDASTTRGATGTASFVAGVNTTASGINSLAFGAESIASELNTSAFGFSTIASGQTSMAIGDDTEAKASGSLAVGISNTDYTVANDGTDRLFIVGNGVSRGARSDAFIVQLDGTITAPSLTTAEIDAAGNKALITKEYLDANGGSGTGELAEVSEGGNTGYRLADADAANYGDIGSDAVDLSIQENSSSLTGARGTQSFASGLNVTASGANSVAMGEVSVASGSNSVAIGSGVASGDDSTALGSSTLASGEFSTALGASSIASGTGSTAMGSTTAPSAGETTLGYFNTSYTPTSTSLPSATDRLFTIGNGDVDIILGSVTRSDAFMILKNGTITAPSFDISEITDDKALITKEYFEANDQTGTAGVERITEGGVLGYRRTDANPDNFGNIGSNAFDLSGSLSPSTVNGATGRLSFASGGATIASGNISTAMGRFSKASGSFSTAMGNSTTAVSENELAAGSFNTDYIVANNDTDRLLVLGNGLADDARSDALIIQKNGTITAPSLSVAEIDTAGNTALTTKEFTDENYIGRLPSGNTAARPATAPEFGTMRYNTQTGRPEVYVENSTDVAEGNTYIPGWVRL